MGKREMPCFFEDLPPAEFQTPTSPTTAATAVERPMTIEEIVRTDPNAILWKDLDYGHLIVHPNLWVFCAKCHLGILFFFWCHGH